MQEKIWKQAGETWITIYGEIYDVYDYVRHHPGGMQAILDFLGNDASRFFPHLPPAYLPDFCLNTNKSDFLATHNTPICPEMNVKDLLVDNLPCHVNVTGVLAVHNKFKQYKVGDLLVPSWDLGWHGMQWIVIDQNANNITQYVDGLIDNKTGVVTSDPEHPSAYLHPKSHLLIMSKCNMDATKEYHKLFDTDQYLTQYVNIT